MQYWQSWLDLTQLQLPATGAAILASLSLVLWSAKQFWQRRTFQPQSDLLLQTELQGQVIDFVAMLAAEDRRHKPLYEWRIQQIDGDDFPYTQMTDLPFTHITVRQKHNEGDLLTVSVIQRKAGLWRKDFYWVREATIGRRPGFPRLLLLPHNFVLKISV